MKLRSVNLLFFIKILMLISASLLAAGCSEDPASVAGTDRDREADASYRVSFTSAWSSTVFPTGFPAGAHFSALTGATHNDQIKIWEIGQLASEGIESMAETGSQDALIAEVEAAKKVGTVDFVLGGEGNAAVGTAILEFDINVLYPLVTLVSMVAPSPDWFVGVRDLSLFDVTADDWVQTLEVALMVYDAGTDSGLSFNSGDSDTRPPEIINLLSSSAADTDFVDGVGPAGEFIGTFKFERTK